MIPVTRNDSIYLDFISIYNNTQLTITALVISKTGKIIKFERTFKGGSANNSVIKTMSLTSGNLVSLSVRDELRTLDWGTTLATAGITRIIPNPITNIQPNQVQLVTGYISRSHQLSYPTGTNLPPLTNQGLHGMQAVQTPNPGNELANVTANNQIKKFYGFRFTFQTSSQVANRRVNVNIREGNKGIYRTASDSQQTASKTIIYSFYSGINEQPLNDNIHVQSVPLLTLPPGSFVETITTGIQSDDQFSAAYILYETFLVTN